MTRRAVRWFLCAALLPFPSAVLVAQHEEHAHGPDEMAEVGRVHFATSCSPAAQKEFDRAVATLHSFWYEEAEKTFRAVAASDPRCAMAWWGVAMSAYHPIWYPPTPADLAKGREALAKARAIGGGSEREKAYLSALEVFYADSERVDHRTRATAYERAMEQVAERYPEDREASVFYALALLWTLAVSPADEANPRKAATVLDRIGAEMPDHPGVLHYSIHAYDTPNLAHLGLNAANRYAKVAPAVPHALHMPSHIYTRLGLWSESIASNTASAKAGRDFARRTGMRGAWSQELHALDYLEYAYLQRGDDAGAKRILERIREVRGAEPVDTTSAYALAAVPVRYAVERGRLEELRTAELSPADFPWKEFPVTEAMTRWGRALAASRAGDSEGARREIDRLAALRDAARSQTGYDWASVIEVLRLEGEAVLAGASGSKDEAVRLLSAAAELEDATPKHAVTPGPIRPARELLAETLAAAGRPQDASREYARALQAAPNRFRSLIGAARAAAAAGKPDLARDYSQKLVAATDPSSSRPELQEARKLLDAAPAKSAASSSGR